jgi:hypothetical protein
MLHRIALLGAASAIAILGALPAARADIIQTATGTGTVFSSVSLTGGAEIASFTYTAAVSGLTGSETLTVDGFSASLTAASASATITSGLLTGSEASALAAGTEIVALSGSGSVGPETLDMQVPEPASMAILGSGLLGLGSILRRRRRS